MWLLLVALALAGIYLLVRGFLIEPGALRLEEVKLELDAAGGECSCQLLHLTDLHLRSEPTYESKILELAQAARPDLIVLTGDYVDDPRHLPALRRVASGLTALCPVYAVLGDNDLEAKGWVANRRQLPELVAATLAEAGVQVLRNAGVVVSGHRYRLFVAGIDDPRMPTADLASALKDRPAGVPTILLSHSAEAWKTAEAAGVDLLLAGHTHGGQVRLPGWGAIYTNDRLGRRFAAGLVRRGRLLIYVSRGVGWAKLRVRLFCPPVMAIHTISNRPYR